MSDANSPAGSPVEPTHTENEEYPDIQDDAAGSDKDSDLLSEIDEEQFDDYDPTLEDRPVDCVFEVLHVSS